MDYKLTYISRLFQKTSNKIYEHYIITRIWHLLNNDEIEMIAQQYVRLENKYALTDIYFPQFNIHVEVNEPAHYITPEKIEFDINRNESIINISQHQIQIFDCRKPIEEIHNDIDDFIKHINSLISNQLKNNTFKSWNPNQDRNPLYWKEQKAITSNDNIALNNVEDICTLFDADFSKTKRGFLRKGAIAHPQNRNIIIWWPSSKKRQKWQNFYDAEKGIIIEENIDEEQNSNHLNYLLSVNETRLLFYHYKDFLGLTSYRFKGAFKLEKEESENKKIIIWKKISDKFNLLTSEVE